MKNDLFSIGKVEIHGYGLMIGLGILCCLLLGLYRAKKKDMSQEAVLDIALIAVFAGFLGAKILFVIVEFREFIEDPLAVLGSEGFVVYGGIIAGVAGVMIYCRRKGYLFLEYFDLLVPSLAVAQGFGRIGCFLAGCCYGRETASILGVAFPEGGLAPAGVSLLPTQLFSAAGDFIIAAWLLLYNRKAKHIGDVGAMYLLLYGIGRFFLEFLRADDRGALGFLSTSQLISIVIVIVSLVMFRKNKKVF